MAQLTVADEALHGDDDQSLMVLDELLVTRSGVRAPHLARAGTEPGVGAGAPSRFADRLRQLGVPHGCRRWARFENP